VSQLHCEGFAGAANLRALGACKGLVEKQVVVNAMRLVKKCGWFTGKINNAGESSRQWVSRLG
jgi:hypothetical protein